MKISAATVFWALALSGLASANIIPTPLTPTTSAGVTTYSYTLTLSAGEDVITNSEFCIAGLTGLTGTPTAPTNWTATNQTGSACPIAAGTTPSDNKAESVLYKYTGSATIVGSENSLGTFTLKSTDAVVGSLNDAYGASTEGTNPVGPVGNQGELNGPLAPAGTPEPATLSLIGCSLLGLGLFRHKIGFSRSTPKAG